MALEAPCTSTCPGGTNRIEVHLRSIWWASTTLIKRICIKGDLWWWGSWSFLPFHAPTWNRPKSITFQGLFGMQGSLLWQDDEVAWRRSISFYLENTTVFTHVIWRTGPWRKKGWEPLGDGGSLPFQMLRWSRVKSSAFEKQLWF